MHVVKNFRMAIETRDAKYEGIFWYGVRTTGIYCRPTCPSRQPKPENVVFFALPEAARRAGFRACLRCHPDQVTLSDPQAELVQSVCRLIDLNLDEAPNLENLGHQVKLSRFHLQRLFKKLMGITPRQYAEARRAEKFKTRIKAGESVSDAIYEAGYGSSSRLYEKSDSQLGMTPATYRKGGEGMSIKYATMKSTLGQLLVAATERGICSVTLGESDRELVDQLHVEFPRATIEPDERHLQERARIIIDYLKGQLPHPRLPLDVQGTAFQKRVWEELRRIPEGETASYSEVARRIGQPRSTRAVAGACATNPAAIITPCHRVVRENGELGG
ncbi:MAG: bifunctional DNA-binding transcriptional regulator/O6-methylguanine-DNA methyltransferase Ada, partial [Acidobacteria bacterium]|nr:bifunctional DNA-binding transcriptional regulator/O6-methylguanine-DNA methyltransferase Ada [Acidobacteriota bacterium]